MTIDYFLPGHAPDVIDLLRASLNDARTGAIVTSSRFEVPLPTPSARLFSIRAVGRVDATPHGVRMTGVVEETPTSRRTPAVVVAALVLWGGWRAVGDGHLSPLLAALFGASALVAILSPARQRALSQAEAHLRREVDQTRALAIAHVAAALGLPP